MKISLLKVFIIVVLLFLGLIFTCVAGPIAISWVKDVAGIYAYESSTKVAGVNIRTALAHSHPFLAEYKRYVFVEDGKRIPLGIDSGGFDYINVYELDDKIILQTFWPDILIIEKAGKRHRFETRPLTYQEIAGFVGKFNFPERGNWRYSPKEEDASFKSEVMKGG